MNESAEYTRLLAQAYSKLADDYVAMTQRVIAAEARVKELEVALAVIGYVEEMETSCDSEQLKCAQATGCQQGGAK